ncbi:SpoIVB peptidase [Sporolactobacillus sp. THM7-7]|nr:SpoIVB peptidase [Sporolactobacillus sp. THM7-7]
MRKRKWMRLMTGFVLLSFFVSLFGSMPHQNVNHEQSRNEAQRPYALMTGSPSNASHVLHSRYQPVSHFPLEEGRAFFTIPSDAPKHLRLIPGGQSIGVKLNTLGVLVVGYHLINGESGQVSPGENAGIRVGDVITKINGKKVKNTADVRQIIAHSTENDALRLSILRQRAQLTKTLTPIKDKSAQHYRMGLYIRDSASGIGTMTFYDPKTSAYGALGHIISDRDTGQPIQMNDGQIVRSKVQAIDRGAEGKPGEKIAFFPDHAASIGSVEKNTPFGIYGYLHKSNDGSMRNRQAIPVAFSNEVKEGPAQILTVLNGDKVQAYQIRIINAVPQKYPATKGLIIKITDPRLLEKTGGIIQGMSGSPIIQNGKLVGAVTHVFVHDPTSGYGVHIEWMLEEAGLNNRSLNGRKAAS